MTIKKEVLLQNQSTVTIGRATWRMWKQIKTEVLTAMTSEEFQKTTGSILSAVQQSSKENDTFEELTFTSVLSHLDKELTVSLPGLLATVSRVLDSMTEAIIRDALLSGNERKEQLVDEMIKGFDALDFIEVRNAATQLNDWKGMFAAEKNSFMAMMPDLMPGLPEMEDGSETESSSTGGQDGSQSSSDTVGVGKTSGDVQPAKSSSTSSMQEEPSLTS